MTPINLESKKDGLQQRQDGTWTLKLTVNGEDMQNAVDLLKAPMGQRYMVVMVALEEEDEEAAHRALEKATKPKRPWHTLSRAAQAGILCEDERFQDWILEHCNQSADDFIDARDETGDIISEAWTPEKRAAWCVRDACAVGSRKDLDKFGPDKKWDQLVSQFRQETGREAQIR